ncbi:YoaK family protein [Limosilactobacillus vaginalis]|uniref:YoaK family protein n=1 Tax=Limosilactobacillus vaginalis TaxID=1633 RepID=UPI00288BC59C|nr:YoaK family protein [Limosilactobacillus vaginalis]
MNKLLNTHHVEEARLFAIVMTFCGGFLDAFTYIQCGHTLAAAQTGNIVFLAAALVNHNVIGIIDRCGAIILYVLGIIVAITFQAHIKYWRIFCLFPILIIGGFVGAMPENFPTYLSVGLVSFGLALLNTAFSKIEGLGYSSVFTTGNIKKSVVFGTEYIYHHRQQDLKITVNYFIVVLAFTLGAISSAIIQPFSRMKTIWVAVAIILLTDIFYYYQKVHESN